MVCIRIPSEKCIYRHTGTWTMAVILQDIGVIYTWIVNSVILLETHTGRKTRAEGELVKLEPQDQLTA